jgi:hypothetical protein
MPGRRIWHSWPRASLRRFTSSPPRPATFPQISSASSRLRPLRWRGRRKFPLRPFGTAATNRLVSRPTLGAVDRLGKRRSWLQPPALLTRATVVLPPALARPLALPAVLPARQIRKVLVRQPVLRLECAYLTHCRPVSRPRCLPRVGCGLSTLVQIAHREDQRRFELSPWAGCTRSTRRRDA